VATIDGRLAGAVRVQVLDDATGELGMLAADHAYRGVGVGRELVAFAEGLSRDRGHRRMQLELLVPASASIRTRSSSTTGPAASATGSCGRSASRTPIRTSRPCSPRNVNS
jgi:GNAT superfamily N-acetyltransferase